jgi:hypothetical protein
VPPSTECQAHDARTHRGWAEDACVQPQPEDDGTEAPGASFTGVTVRVTVAAGESAFPSLALKVNASGPL